MPPAIIAAVIAGGAGLGAAAISKSGSSSIANQQKQQADQLFQRSQPAYQQAQNYYSGLMQNPLQQPNITDAQLQFNQARQNIVNGSYSRGGGLDAGLSNLEAGRAVTLSQLISGGRNQAAAGLSGLATGQSGQSLAGLAGAQQSQAQNSLMQSQAYGGIGSFLTRLISSGGLSSLTGMFGQGGGNNSYFGVNMNNTGNGNIPAAVVPNTGQMYPGANEPFASNY